MRRALSVGLAVVLGIGVTFAVVRSARGGGHRANAVTTTLIRGVSGSEKQAFFQDPEVTADFAKHGYRLQVDYAGSREIAGASRWLEAAAVLENPTKPTAASAAAIHACPVFIF